MTPRAAVTASETKQSFIHGAWLWMLVTIKRRMAARYSSCNMPIKSQLQIAQVMSQIILNSRGFFWWSDEPIPDGKFAPLSAVPGTLDIDETGTSYLSLDVVLPRESGRRSIFQNDEETRPIQGILASNSYVMLSELIPNGSTIRQVGPQSEAFIANRCLISDAAFSSEREPVFKSIQLSLKGLEDWLGLESIEVSESDSVIAARFARHSGKCWKLPIGELELKYEFLYPEPGKHYSVAIQENAHLILNLENTAEVYMLIDLFEKIESFLVILTDYNFNLAFPKLVSAYTNNTISLFYSKIVRKSVQLNHKYHWVRFGQIEEYFGDIMIAWLEKYETVGAGFYLYIASRRDDLCVEHRFATLIWGLESLHRRAHPPHDNAALRNKVERIIKQIERTKDKKYIQAKLMPDGMPEIPLSCRLYDIFKKIQLPINDKHIKQFAENVASRRNELSHHGGTKTGENDSFLDSLLQLNKVLDLLYHAALLTEIGVLDSAIKYQLTSGPRHYQIGKMLEAAGIPLVKLS